MAQPNVAREPSMEEILASIRRIIESNEPTSENVLSRPLPPVYGEEETDEAEEMGFAPDMAANDPGVPSRNEPMNFPSAPINQPAQSERTLSLADVAARVRAASVRQQEPGNVRLATASTAPAPPAPVQASRREEPASERPSMPRMPEFREPAPVAPLNPPTAAAQPAAPQPEPVRRPPPSIFEPAEPAPVKSETPVRSEPRQEPRLAPEPPASRSLPAKIEEAANLLSVEAGAQVAKSFSELAAVFNGMERRSLEDMAGDMLRPMLQEWLDDNLPTLVERLVREEIERVARGTRR
ncbi:PopZ family protein [Rhizobium terrae]|uniref:PopZ family protein n=1 Tax=Rhizobium terrae TaxID=2171756 RepID=UPI000E3CFEFD|nr:DUF2497 domain-containing protein [Rhizobium terrae]